AFRAFGLRRRRGDLFCALHADCRLSAGAKADRVHEIEEPHDHHLRTSWQNRILCAGRRVGRNPDRHAQDNRHPNRNTLIRPASSLRRPPSPDNAQAATNRAGNMERATLIGFSAVIMWALLALFTSASGSVPPFQLSAITFAIGTLVGFAMRTVF